MLFGELPIDVGALAAVLCGKIPPLARKLAEETGRNQCRDGVWTDAVYQVLKREGDGLQMTVHCMGHGNPGWLFDVVWKLPNDSGLAMICESEWSQNSSGVVYDFRKLLVGKAPLKLLIYDGGNCERDGQGVRDEIKKVMEAYRFHVQNEVYLLVSLGNFGKNPYAHEFVVPNDGPVEDVRFLRIGTEEKKRAAAS